MALSAQFNNVSNNPSNTGAIAGGVVGGVIVLALIGGLGWFLGRRHNRKKASDTTRPYAPEMASEPENHVGAWAANQQKRNYGYANSELPSDGSHTRSEAPGDGAHRHELGG